MIKNWQTLPLEKCIKKVENTTKILKKNFLVSGRFPVISQESELVSGYWDKKDDVFNTDEPVVVYGDHTRVVKYVDFKFVKGADGIKILQPKEFLNARYLYYYLICYEIKSLGYARHYRLLKDLPVYYPSISEQERIVAIMDEKFEAIEELEKVIKEQLIGAKEIFENYVFDMFNNPKDDWISATLSDVCEKITDGTHQTPKYFDKGVVFLSSRNVTSRRIDWDNIKYIDQEQHEAMHKRVAPRMGDILLAKNGTTGVAAMVDRDTIFDIYVSLAHLRPLEHISGEFLLYFINSLVAKKQFNKRLKGMGVPNLHLEEIREVVINYPESISEQKRIVKVLDSVSQKSRTLEEVFKKKINDLEELKKSYLEQAFTGKL